MVDWLKSVKTNSMTNDQEDLSPNVSGPLFYGPNRFITSTPAYEHSYEDDFSIGPYREDAAKFTSGDAAPSFIAPPTTEETNVETNENFEIQRNTRSDGSQIVITDSMFSNSATSPDILNEQLQQTENSPKTSEVRSVTESVPHIVREQPFSETEDIVIIGEKANTNKIVDESGIECIGTFKAPNMAWRSRYLPTKFRKEIRCNEKTKRCSGDSIPVFHEKIINYYNSDEKPMDPDLHDDARINIDHEPSCRYARPRPPFTHSTLKQVVHTGYPCSAPSNSCSGAKRKRVCENRGNDIAPLRMPMDCFPSSRDGNARSCEIHNETYISPHLKRRRDEQVIVDLNELRMCDKIIEEYVNGHGSRPNGKNANEKILQKSESENNINGKVPDVETVSTLERSPEIALPSGIEIIEKRPLSIETIRHARHRQIIRFRRRRVNEDKKWRKYMRDKMNREMLGIFDYLYFVVLLCASTYISYFATSFIFM